MKKFFLGFLLIMRYLIGAIGFVNLFLYIFLNEIIGELESERKIRIQRIQDEIDEIRGKILEGISYKH